MKRIDAISAIAKEGEDALIICNIGFPSRELYAVRDRLENFYMLGSMGMASSIGLGLALARPDRKVISIDGDGAVLMNLGTLATIANYAPDNYLLVILDNCAYGSTGCQPTATYGRTDLNQVARAAGIREVQTPLTLEELKVSMGSRSCRVLVVKVEAGNAEVPIIDISTKQILERFRGVLRAESSEYLGHPES
jgi:sulfopyruvate decarboxylase subunit beta